MAFGGVRELTLEWLDASKKEGNALKSFMLLWVAFNSWTTCVTELDTDKKINMILSESGRFANNFASAFGANEHFQTSVVALSGFFPVYDGRAYRRKAASLGAPISADLVLFRGDGDNWGIAKSPPNWLVGNQPTWRDCLLGIYKIRCNLFHGQKQQTIQSDVAIVAHARDVLSKFIEISGCFGWHDAEQVMVVF